MSKRFKIAPEEIKPITEGRGGCIATDLITVDGNPVRYMYREAPDHETDSGWRFLSGHESDEYLDIPDNHGVYDVNTIANYDTSIVPFLDAPAGSAFAKASDAAGFVSVKDSSSSSRNRP